LHVFVSEHPYAIYSDVFSEERERQCQRNLEALYGLLKQYDQKHGRLPPAAFFPAKPLSDPASLAVILGKEAQRHLVCPTSGLDFQQLGLNYIWNEKLNGKKLSDAADSWLLMDFVATHDWMTANHFCGHRGNVNVLLANGLVQRSLPYAYESRSARDKTVRTWLDWANE